MQAVRTSEADIAASYRDEIEDAVGEDRPQDALACLLDFVRDLAPQLRHEALMLSQGHSAWVRAHRRGLAKREDVTPIISRVLEFTGRFIVSRPGRLGLGAPRTRRLAIQLHGKAWG